MSKDVTEIYDVVPVFAVDESGKALITEEQYSWLCNYAVRKAERAQELEFYVDINSKKHVNLNEFLQKRYLPKYLGLHVVDAAIDYVETLENGSESFQNMIKIARNTIDELEQQNKRYREVIEETLQTMGVVDKQRYGKVLEGALEGESNE